MNANLLVGEVYDDTSAQTRGHIFRNTGEISYSCEMTQ